jgi:hypothetical protein
MDDCVQKVGGYFKQYYISKQRIQQPKKLQIQNPDITGSVTVPVLGTVLYSITFDADQDPSLFTSMRIRIGIFSLMRIGILLLIKMIRTNQRPLV